MVNWIQSFENKLVIADMFQQTTQCVASSAGDYAGTHTIDFEQLINLLNERQQEVEQLREDLVHASLNSNKIQVESANERKQQQKQIHYLKKKISQQQHDIKVLQKKYEKLKVVPQVAERNITLYGLPLSWIMVMLLCSCFLLSTIAAWIVAGRERRATQKEQREFLLRVVHLLEEFEASSAAVPPAGTSSGDNRVFEETDPPGPSQLFLPEREKNMVPSE
tara:strand:- start:413 stop:1075 length:663 start_codon:yes stop_codon:yes gene_type:complete